jgi:hypothetical protein
MTLRLSILLLTFGLAAPIARPMAAQTPARDGRPDWSAVRVAKWALLASAAGFAAYALTRSTRAEDSYEALRRLCETEPARCTLSSGRYADAAAEQFYRTARREDRRAQVGIVGGQVTLLGSVGLFIYDLRNGRGPANIPYPSAHARAVPGHTVGAGVRLSF